MSLFRRIPSIEQLLARPLLEHAAAEHGRDAVTRAARIAASDLRVHLAAEATPSMTSDDAVAWLETRTLELVGAQTAPSLRPVINATGVIVHTNLGRAPLASAAAASAARIGAGYSNLEFDLAEGTRGRRHVHAERLLCSLTGAEGAVVVNNAAAAALLALAALTRGREVIVSRGELVEIGDGFRVPEVLAESGAVMREVGTTNRTRISDYGAAIGPRTAAILRVHPSNFEITGFTERPAVLELVTLARRFNIPVIEDLGSGWLGGMPAPPPLAGEPSVSDSVAAGVDLVIFSGDKLLGGPQAGIVVGRREFVARLKSSPLMRAVRVDKLTYAALEATLALWAEEPSRLKIPLMRMLAASPADIEQRARAIAGSLRDASAIVCEVIDGASTIGGGSAAGSELPTRLLAVSRGGTSAADLAAELRRHDPPIIGRVHQERVVLDLRTVAPEDDAAIAEALRT
ncbi:MAG TPA: L-seryl-tRNA(Sec) selenium transferase [Vicinamibacterales bacterium]|nr:L-seryl-tRNA(Sec) selenium transferase [Vicinamibacterales bacterium]